MTAIRRTLPLATAALGVLAGLAVGHLASQPTPPSQTRPVAASTVQDQPNAHPLTLPLGVRLQREAGPGYEVVLDSTDGSFRVEPYPAPTLPPAPRCEEDELVVWDWVANDVRAPIACLHADTWQALAEDAYRADARAAGTLANVK